MHGCMACIGEWVHEWVRGGVLVLLPVPIAEREPGCVGPILYHNILCYVACRTSHLRPRRVTWDYSLLQVFYGAYIAVEDIYSAQEVGRAALTFPRT